MAETKKEKALIAMSGGVDSSVAACLMTEAGYECIGVTMKLFDNGDIGINKEHSCCSLSDVEDARNVATSLGMKYYVFNFMDRFKDMVMTPFAQAYENGCTPNPCIDCNRFLKFDKLYSRAKELGCEYVVTGHYARIEQDPKTGRWLLKDAADGNKDQSYVLYSLTQDQLAHTKFPLGGMTKPEARKLAEEHGFVNAHKHDSQDICFVPDGKYADFIEDFTGKKYPAGQFIGTNGEVYGQHKGIIHYTVGQRKGLGISFPQPMYVTKVDPADNTVTLGKHEELFSTTLTANDVNLISVEKITEPMRVTAKVRYRQPARPATVTQNEDGTIKVVFDEHQRAITKGQAVVLYDGDIVVGGGTITETENG